MSGNGWDLDDEDLEKFNGFKNNLNIKREHDYRNAIIKLIICLGHFGYKVKSNKLDLSQICTNKWIGHPHVRTEPDGSSNYFFNISLNLLSENSFYFFICGRHKFCYIIPREKMIELSNVTTIRDTVTKFHIDNQLRVYLPGNGEKLDICKYYQNVNQLPK